MLKSIKIAISLCLILNFTSIKVNSQNLINQPERNFHINIKQFNEFVDRFNYKTDFKGNNIDSSFSLKISREEYLSLLFNVEDERLKTSNVDLSNEYIQLKDEFINEIVTNNLFIDKYSNKIIAEAKSSVIYNNQTEIISIFLIQEIVDNSVKWVLLSIKADFLDVLQEDTSLLRFIPPTSNEVNFISLKRVFDDKFFQHYYSYKGYKYDPLSSFLFALNTGLVKYEYVNEIVYHIFDINDWHIQIKEFIRNTENSGWLIDDISKKGNTFETSLENLISY